MREFAIAPTSTTGLALDTLPGCSNWRVSRWCPATNLIKNPSMKLGTTGYLARNPGGGNLLAITRGSVYAGTQAGYALSSGASLPGVTFDMAYMVTLSTKGKTYTLSIAVMPDVRQLMTLSVIAVAGTDRVIGTVTRDIVCGWERLEVVFPIPTDANFANIPISGLRFELTADRKSTRLNSSHG